MAKPTKKTTRSRASKMTMDVTPRRTTALAKGGARSIKGRSAAPIDPRKMLTMLPMPQSIAGIRLSHQEAMQLSVVWACIDAIVKAIVCCSWDVYARKDGGQREQLFDDPIEWLLNKRPNSETTAIGWREAMYYSAVGTGNGYSEIVRNGAGKTTGLYWIETDRVSPRREILEDGQPGDIVYDVAQYSGGWVTLRAMDIFHLRGPSLDSLTGDHMIARAAHAIANAVAAERFRGNYFANNTVMGTILKHPRTLTETAHKRLTKDYEDKHKGPHKAHKPLILEGGMDIVTNVGNDPQKSQMVEASYFGVEEICRFFGVPPHKVQHLLRATYNNIEHLGIEFTRDAVTPWARRGEQEADFKLFPQKAPWRETRFDTEWLTYGDAKSRAEAEQIHLRTGVFTINEIRRKRRENTIGKSGDVRIVEANMTTLDALMENTRKAVAEADKAERDAEAPAPTELPPGPDNKPPAPEEKPPAPKEKPPSPKKALHAAITHNVVGSLERYSRRLANREQDLRRSGKHDEVAIAVHMATERSEQRPRLTEEILEALQIAASAQPNLDLSTAEHGVVSAADLVDNCGDVRAAAEGLVNRYLGSEE